ncbi:MAG TPA: hypothetical protein VHE60_00680 [Pyrinomonadaceae bacterium]|nr:hypothetical protein [Pyrinomonadaceae bacterium]
MRLKRINKLESRILYLTLLVALLSLSAQIANAQSTLVTIPSTGVVSAGAVYLEFDFISHYASHHNGGFQTYASRAVVGVGHNVEVGVNVVYTGGFGVNQPIEIQPNIKWRFYQNEKQRVSAAVGVMLYAPITHRTGTNTFVMLYALVSKKMAGKFGPRFTGGGYALPGRDDGTGAKAGAMAGYEQPLAPRVSFVMDWASGRNRFGYVTPGLSFATTQHSNLYTGYSIGNHGRGNNALFAYYGITF